jgi:hypothetical protein
MGFTKNIRFDYSTSINEPSVKQLQPVTSNTDPLNLYYGNPNLKPEYQHSLSAFYQSFNMKSGVHFFTALNTTYTLDKIQDARWTNSQYTSIYKPVNVPNDLTSSLMVNFGFRLQKPVLRMHFRANTSYSRSLAYINDVENRTNRYTTGGGVRLGYEIGDVFEIHTDARLNYNIAQYSVSSNLNSTYLNQIYSADMTIKLPWKLQIAGNSDFNIYNGATGFSSKNVFLVGAALSKFLFEKDRGELKLSVTDLLNQNTGIIRTTDVQYIENGYIRSLGRYIMLSFTYKVSAFPSGMKGMGPPGGPGMMRMMMGK